MAGIETMTPYRDPREELRKAVFAAQKAAPVSPAAPAAAAIDAIPVGHAEPMARVPREFAKAGIKVPGAGIAGAANSVLDADVGSAAAKAAKATGGAAAGTARKAIGTLTSGLGRVAIPVGMASQAVQTANTDTADYYARTGVEPEATVVPQVVKDIGVRSLGTLQDIGNNATFGIADRVGNLIAGNGFNRSAGNQVGEIGASGAEVGAKPQAAAIPLPAGTTPSAGAADMAMRRGAARDAAGAAEAATTPPATGVITFDPKTKTYSGTDVKEGASITGGIGGGRGTGRGTVTTLPTPGVDGYMNQLANIRALGPAPDNTIGQGAAGIGDSGAKAGTVPPSDIARLSKGGRGGRAQAAAILQAQQQELQAAQAGRSAELMARGQDIGAATQREGTAAQRDIAAMQGRNQRDIAELTSEGRIAAAEARANPTVVVGGGSIPVDDGFGGVKYVPAPQRLVNRVTGEEIGTRPQLPAAPSAPPAKGAVVKKGDTSYRFKGGDPSKPESWEKV